MELSTQKEQLTKLVLEEDLSSVPILSERLRIGEDEVKSILQELVSEGILKGRLTSDGQRFYREDLKVSGRPMVPSHEEEPAFMRFNLKPGKYAAAVGLFVVVSGYAILILAHGDFNAENLGLVLLFLGLFLLILGCYYVGRRKTPS